MKSLSSAAFRQEELLFRGIDAMEQRWRGGTRYPYYHDKPRPYSGIYFVRNDVRVLFTTRDGKIVEIRRNHAVLLPAGMCYDVELLRDTPGTGADVYLINFDAFTADGVPVTFGTHPVLLTQTLPPDTLPLPALVRACHELPPAPLSVHTLFYEILSAVFAPPSDASDYPIRRGIALLRTEWAENYKMSRYAAVCGISESHFHALFRAFAGKTPVQYRNYLRVSYAKSLLCNSDTRVEEIARAVGFDDAFYFSRLFKSLTGASPRQWRAAH